MNNNPLEEKLKLITNDFVEGKEEEVRERNTPPRFRVITGGKGPPGANWLIKLPIGTVFLIKDTYDRSAFALGEYHLTYKEGSSVLLFTNTNQELYTWVDSARFSARFELVGVLYGGPNE